MSNQRKIELLARDGQRVGIRVRNQVISPRVREQVTRVRSLSVLRLLTRQLQLMVVELEANDVFVSYLGRPPGTANAVF